MENNNTSGDPEIPAALPLLLEIGTEEIPSRFLPGAISNLKDIAAKYFIEYRLESKGIGSFATPRRLGLIVEKIPSKQKDVVKEVFGPSKKAAFDSEGNPTKAAVGFANSLGIKTTDLIIKLKGKNEYLAAVIEEKGLDTSAVLPEVLRNIILSLHFPKAMRWGNGNMSFVRPIHWIAAIYGTEIIHFEIDGLNSSNMTRGHRFLSPATFRVNDVSFYMSLLENNFVIADHIKRKELIRKGINGLFFDPEQHPIIDEELLDIVNFLVEYPVPVLCSFNSEYLNLPKELLVTVMKDHQKYFAVQDNNGRLLNHFVVVSNTKAENEETIRTGAERVIKARFDDAKFYFHEDAKKPLANRVEDLKQVTFHNKLGTLFDKTGRITKIAAYLAEKLDPSVRDNLLKAAVLSKTDLITGVVREFPELQGVMGKYYARLNGEDSSVADSIEEQYLPKYFGGSLPQTDIGALLSLSDKIDSISSFFVIGVIPTGSEDPFALRRQAMGIVSILLDRQYNLTLKDIFETALELLKDVPKSKSNADTISGLLSFMEQRVEFIFSSMNYAPDLIRSVLALSSVCPLNSIKGRIEALNKFREKEIFPDFLLGIKRVCNIIPKTPLPLIRTDLLLLEEEKDLHKAYERLYSKVKTLIEEERFYDSLNTFSEITTPVNNFFDKVLVMDNNEEIKANRLALLKEIWATSALLADFSKLL